MRYRTWQFPLFVASLALCFSGTPAAAQSFTVRSASPIDRIVYFLAGEFGGYGGYVASPEKDGTYRIPLVGMGSRPKALKAILYAPGCQIEVLSVDLVSSSTRSAKVGCRPLNTINLRGRLSTRRSDSASLDVQILYVAGWDHTFFHILDGMVQTFLVGRAPLDAEGRFQVRIPDFSKDLVTIQMKEAYLQVLVVERSGGNLVGQLLPSPDLQYEGLGLKILPSYESELAFGER